jgi:hypothetical protein
VLSVIYELIGRLVVEFVRRRYRSQIRAAAAAGAALAVIGVGAYLAASRDEDESG